MTGIRTGDDAHRESIRTRVADDSAFDTTFVVMNALATIIACYGLLEDSSAVVIGAMIIAMLLGPISGVGLALVDADNALLRRAAFTLVGGLLVVILTAFVIGLVHRDIPATEQMLARTTPNAFDLMIGLAGGAAGAFAISSKRLDLAFVGVAIATALVPPLATFSMLLARGDFSLAGGALLLALTNIVAIQFACSIVFFFAGFRNLTRGRAAGSGVFWRNAASTALLAALAIVLTINSRIAISRLLYENKVRHSLNTAVGLHPGAFLVGVRFSHTRDSTLVRAIVRGPESLSAHEVARVERLLAAAPGGRRSVLIVRFVTTATMSSSGPVNAGDGLADGGAVDRSK